MALWGNRDLANNVPISVPSQLNKSPTANNAADTWHNANANTHFVNATVGTWGITPAEQQANGVSRGITHAGWQLKTEGHGGRAGRVFYETLVASGSMTT